nr:immunoglobulin light chain junction region [Macaca mulatta]MOV94203.1 immunoglobulin light chain junction region [Macaca mulatta]MOV94279.1 immunoglobulin light chain junction region [Macaca mulatta]MOV94329.1 immunoglobulin light chain junction region [Macaca mulatta]MOV94349.1 immunoglobulin light chain junction region [Macaca mulatta]
DYYCAIWHSSASGLF